MAYFTPQYHTLKMRMLKKEVIKRKKVESFEKVASKLPCFRVFFGFKSSFRVLFLCFHPINYVQVCIGGNLSK